MSREIISSSLAVGSDGSLKLQPTVIISGNDVILGRFIDVIDMRYAGTEHDPQGEGYLVEWSETFGFGTNKIKIDSMELLQESKVIAKVEQYLKTIKVI